MNLDDDRNIPQEYRIVSRILKNAGVSPPEVHFLKEIAGLKELLEDESENTKKKELQDKIRKLQLKLDFAMEKLNRPVRTYR